MYLLDTNVCIKFLNNRSENIINKMKELNNQDILLNSIVKAELYYGANKSNRRDKVMQLLDNFFSSFDSVIFDDNASLVYGRVKSELESKGNIIGPNDLLIASIAISNDLILVINNTKEFSRIKELSIVDWEK